MGSELYRADMRDDAQHPRHFGKLSDADFVGTASNATCGDEITLWVQTGNHGTRIESATFTGRGCMVTMAAATRFLDHVQQEPLSKTRSINEKQVLAMFGAELTPTRQSCALMAWSAFQQLHPAQSTKKKHGVGTKR